MTPLDVLDLTRFSLFAGLEPAVLEALLPGLQVMALPGGETLFAEGEPAEAVYLVRSGGFIALRGNRPVGHIAAGEAVGEMALISGRPRSATVRALRDSEVLRFERAQFEALIERHPQAMLQLTRLAYQRLETVMSSRPPPRPPRAIAVIPANPGAAVWPFAEGLKAALDRYGRVAVLGEPECRHWVSGDFHDLEQQGHTLLYVAEHPGDAWAERCHRQADAVLLLGDARHAPTPAWLAPDGLRQLRLVLDHGGPLVPGRAARWRAVWGSLPLHHLRDREDIPRIARQLCGQATALVLSGGGARGFAHLGVLQALREAGLEIDAIGATSIGAVIGAGIASQWDELALEAAYRRCFVQTNPLSDYTFPFVSLVAGRKASRLLRREFGEIDIEDLPLPFFCISANLTRACVHVHDRGLLWQALRASIAIPGVLPPVFQHGEVLVDGGVIDNLPIDLMRGRHQGRIIGVDIAGDYALATDVHEADPPPLWRMVWEHLSGRAHRPGIVRILLRSGMVNAATTSVANRAHSSLLITPPVGEIDLLDWKSFDRAIRIGYDHTRALLADWPGW